MDAALEGGRAENYAPGAALCKWIDSGDRRGLDIMVRVRRHQDALPKLIWNEGSQTTAFEVVSSSACMLYRAQKNGAGVAG
jgi:hypothetical protein